MENYKHVPQLNTCHFSGRLTRDAEIVYATTGTGVVKFTVACSCGFGQNKRVEYLDFIKFNAEKLTPYLVKGKPVIIYNCEYQLRKWQDREGNQQSRPQFIAGQVVFHLQDNTGNNQQSQNSMPNQSSSNGMIDDAPF